MQYKIVWRYYVSSLESEVNDLCKEGWRPQGGVAISKDGYYYQAMVKDNEDDLVESSSEFLVTQG